jgi:hypothetical protein
MVKVKPPWLNGLELDGYNDDLKLAFEYQGKQHYEWVPYFHKEEKQFDDQQERDQRKYAACSARDVCLIVIPYHFTHRSPKKMEVFIRDQLVAAGKLIVLQKADLADPDEVK